MCQLPKEGGGEATVVNYVVVVGIEVTGSQEGGDEVVHIIASSELIGSKVTGFSQIEVRAGIVVISRGEEGGDEIVLIIASGELIGSKVPGFPRIEIRAAIVVISRGEEALEQSLLVRAEGGADLAIRGGRIRPRVSTSSPRRHSTGRRQLTGEEPRKLELQRKQREQGGRCWMRAL